MTFLKFLETKNLTLEQFKLKSAEEKKALEKEHSELAQKAAEETQEALKQLQEDSEATKEALQNAMNENHQAQVEANKSIMKIVEQQGIALAEAIKSGASKGDRSDLMVEIKENMEAFKNIAKRIGDIKEVTIKADVTRASITNNEQANDLAGVGQLAFARTRAVDLFPTIPMSSTNDNGIVRYYDWDQATTVRAADMVAEGAVFPESTAVWEKFTEELRKIGDTLPVTAEFFEDEQMFAAELQMFLRLNVDLKYNDQIINGDNTGQNLNGLITISPAFVPAASGISDASIYDLIVKVKEDIEASRDGKYMVNFALMNLVDVNLMKLKKDANENYILPPFVDRAGNVVDGITIVVDNSVTANTMFMGDSRFGRKYEKGGVEISRGTVANQFVEDMETLKIRKRALFLVRNVDRTGFSQVTDIAAALVTLATP